MRGCGVKISLSGFQPPVSCDLLDCGEIESLFGERDCDERVSEVVGTMNIVDPSLLGTFQQQITQPCLAKRSSPTIEEDPSVLVISYRPQSRRGSAPGTR